MEGGAKNVTLDGTFALEVTADRSSLLTKGNGTFMVQVYDLENAPYRWEHRVTVEVDNLAVYAKKAMDTVTK